MPHAFKGGAQVALSTAQLRAMRPGGVFVLLSPPDPSRCPRPHERAGSVIAGWPVASAELGATVDEISVPMHLLGPAIWLPIAAEGATELMMNGNRMGNNWRGL